MPRTTTSDESRSGTLVSVWLSAALLVVSSAGVIWYWVGDLSEQVDPRSADYLWHPSEVLIAHDDLVGMVSTVVFAASGVALLVAHRRSETTCWTLAAIGVAALFAAWLGLGYRVVTAAVIGANIGGGGVIFLTPLLALVTFALVWSLGRRSRRGADRSGS